MHRVEALDPRIADAVGPPRQVLRTVEAEPGHGTAALHAEPTPLEHYECRERALRMEAAAREQLSEDQWQLFSLHHLEHRPVREIARVLDKSEDAVKSHLYRARKLLLAR